MQQPPATTVIKVVLKYQCNYFFSLVIFYLILRLLMCCLHVFQRHLVSALQLNLPSTRMLCSDLNTLRLKLVRQKHTSNVVCYFPPRSWANCEQRVCMSVCLFVCLSVCLHILKTTCPHFMKFSVHVTCGRGSDLL